MLQKGVNERRSKHHYFYQILNFTLNWWHHKTRSFLYKWRKKKNEIVLQLCMQYIFESLLMANRVTLNAFSRRKKKKKKNLQSSETIYDKYLFFWFWKGKHSSVIVCSDLATTKYSITYIWLPFSFFATTVSLMWSVQTSTISQCWLSASDYLSNQTVQEASWHLSNFLFRFFNEVFAQKERHERSNQVEELAGTWVIECFEIKKKKKENQKTIIEDLKK